MVESYLRQDALAHRALLRPHEQSPTVRLWLEGARTQLALRGNASDPAFAEIVERITGAALPDAMRVSQGSGADLLWMGPDEWLVVTPNDDGLYLRLDEALAAVPGLVSDVSSSRVILGLGGAHATEILAKGCSLDFHARAFTVDQVAQSTLARAHAMIHRLDQDRGFHIYVHRSFADYLFSWLQDAAGEY